MMTIKKAVFEKSSSAVSQCPSEPLPDFAFIGRSNVGKSSLINKLCGVRGLAKTSSTPGKTQLINHFRVDNRFFIVDLPGYGYASVGKAAKAGFEVMISEYFTNRESLANTYLLIDCRHKPLAIDLDFIQWLGESGVPFTIVFTKIDKLSKTQLQESVRRYQVELSQTWSELPAIILSSADTGVGTDEILQSIESVLKG